MTFNIYVEVLPKRLFSDSSWGAFEEGPCVDYFEQCCETGDVLPQAHETQSPFTSEQSQTCGFRNVEGVGFSTNSKRIAEYGVRLFLN
mgnify:CR=1 FL=1